MTVQDIVCFLKVAETLNYSKTAELLYISQPAVTRHINAMEQETGCRLIDRSIKRSIQLTDAGEILYKALRECEKIYSHAIDQMRVKTEHAVVKINLMRGTTFPDSLVLATKSFMEGHPSFQHFTNFIEYDDFSGALERGEIVICVKEMLPSQKLYNAIKLTAKSMPYYIIMTKRHKAFSDPNEINLNEIMGTALFLPKMLPKAVIDLFERTLLDLFGRLPREIIYLDSADSVSLFLRSNECFTIGTGWDSNILSGEFSTVPLPIFTDYYAVWHPDLEGNHDAVAYIKTLEKVLKQDH